MSDKLCLGYPSNANMIGNAEHVNEMILIHCHIKIRDIASELNVSYCSIFTIIHK